MTHQPATGALLLTATLLATATPALAQERAYPTKVVRFITSLATGSSADAFGRALGSNTSIHLVELGENHIGDPGATALAKGLAANTSIASVDLGRVWPRVQRAFSYPSMCLCVVVALRPARRQCYRRRGRRGAGDGTARQHWSRLA